MIFNRCTENTPKTKFRAAVKSVNRPAQLVYEREDGSIDDSEEELPFDINADTIEITDADVDAEIEKMATMYNMEADKLKEYMGEDEKENMKQDLAVQKAVELITESVKPRAKAKTKKEKEAEAETEAAE